MPLRPTSIAALSLMIAASGRSILAQSRLGIGIRADYPIRGPISYTKFISYSSAPGVDIFEGVFESSAHWNAYSLVTNLPGALIVAESNHGVHLSSPAHRNIRGE